jgi:beta-lactam-binding protein with PASTA domain
MAAAAVVVGAAAAAPPPPDPTAPPADPGWGNIPHCHVPSVVGMTVPAARQKLNGARCDVGFITRKRSKVKKGRVIFSIPNAGTDLASQTEVDLFVSRGRKR